MKLKIRESLFAEILPASAGLRRVLFFLLVGAAPLAAPLAAAHELRPAIATLEVGTDGEMSISLSLNLEAAVADIGAGHMHTSQSPAAAQYDRLRASEPDALRAEFQRFAPVFLDMIAVEAEGTPIPLSIATAAVPEIGNLASSRISELGLRGRLPAGVQRLTWRLAPSLGDSVIRLRNPATGGVAVAEFVRAGETSGVLPVGAMRPRNWPSVFTEYLEVGFLHILPKGLDHILFVAGLFLLSPRLSPLLWQITAFTLAHTAALALSMLEVVRLPSQVVEPLIAASIVYVATENIFTDRLHRWRPVVVFGFGLLHGLGFAGVLEEIGTAPGHFLLSLFSFNFGVELGQLAVIALCFLAVGWTTRYSWHRGAVVVPTSLTIALIGGFWVLERTGIA